MGGRDGCYKMHKVKSVYVSEKDKHSKKVDTDKLNDSYFERLDEFQRRFDFLLCETRLLAVSVGRTAAVAR